jgi:hypothetical protein
MTQAPHVSVVQPLEPEAREFYCHTLNVLSEAGLPFLIGGAYAFSRYTGIERHTKDFDIFVKPEDFEAVLAALGQAGYQTDVPFPHWLGKALHGEYFVDVIFGAGNGVARVDETWFEHSVPETVLDMPSRLVPAEEMVWSKAFIQERERFDGADVAHLLRASGASLDWPRLVRRFGPHWRVLLSHLVLFGFIYPADRTTVPAWVLQHLIQRLQGTLHAPAPTDRVCRGTLLSRQQYLIDVEEWGYADARTRPDNPMTDEDIATWTAGIANDGAPDSSA